MSCMPDMTLTSFVAVVAPRTGKLLKLASVFLKEEKFSTKWYTTLVFNLHRRKKVNKKVYVCHHLVKKVHIPCLALSQPTDAGETNMYMCGLLGVGDIVNLLTSFFPLFLQIVVRSRK